MQPHRAHLPRVQLTIETPDRTMDVVWAPSETDDAVAVWLREDRILYGGPACIPFFPNVGSPQRPFVTRSGGPTPSTVWRAIPPSVDPRVRRTRGGSRRIQEYLVVDERGVALVPRHGGRPDESGLQRHEIVNMVEYPAEIFDKPWLLRATRRERTCFATCIAASSAGGRTRIRPHCNPAHPTDVARELRTAIIEPTGRARSCRECWLIGVTCGWRCTWWICWHSTPVVTTSRWRPGPSRPRCAARPQSSIRRTSTQSLYLNGADELERANAADVG